MDQGRGGPVHLDPELSGSIGGFVGINFPEVQFLPRVRGEKREEGGYKEELEHGKLGRLGNEFPTKK